MLAKIDPSKGTDAEVLDLIRFKDLPFDGKGAREEHLEDLIADNVYLIESAFGDDDSYTLLIIGRQVYTTTQRRMDLVAIDSSGALILIEVKRDAEDVKNRKDHAEIQSVRYAASLAKLRTVDELVSNIYGPYIQRFCNEELQNKGGGRTAEEWARRKLDQFIRENDVDDSQLNHRQEIVLVGASFDEDTKSAAAWIAKYGVPFRVIEVQPIQYGKEYFLNVVQIIPPAEYEDFYVDLVRPRVKSSSGAKSSTKTAGSYSRPRLPKIVEYGLVKKGDELFIRGDKDKRATLIDGKTCRYKGEEMPILKWAKQMKGWSAVNIYDWLGHVPSDKLLEDLRVELEEQLAKEEALTLTDTETDDAAQSTP